MLITDMNVRERRKFADKSDELSSAASKLAGALRTGDDTDVLLHLAMTGISGGFLNELTEIFTEAATGVKIPDSPEQLIAPTKYINPQNNRGEGNK